jgi:serine/threonine protein kinase/tetratricopeptide (TPR) repeat protein
MNELDLFAAAIALADQQERESLLERECSGRPDVRQRLDQLLAAHFRSHPLLDHTGPDLTGPHVCREQPGSVIAGRYKLLKEIGEGGMGTVWLAEQTQPVRRKVAIKLIKAGMDSKQVIARFEAERQALAVMDHPNVAKVLDGGLTDNGRPFFVMEYVKGVPITQYCDATRLSVPQRLHLFAQVCQAVQHAHHKGIIHRDLKPSNILVAPYDDRPVPKIIDFGLAKAMHQSLTDKTLHTAHEAVLGTPLYMSPEQAQLNNLDIDTRSDIYSLGVLLYELLTGTTPLERKRFKQAAWDEIRRIIREEEPPRPSARLSSTDTLPSLAACRQSEPLRLTRLVRGELDWIVMKALEKDRSRRYETANGFALDVQRYLAGEPVLAAPPSARYRLRKLVRRHRGSVIAASLVLCTLLAGIIGTTWGLLAARQARDREAARADGERKAKEQAQEEKKKAIAFRNQALDALRATTGIDVEKLLGAKKELSSNEKAYLEAIAGRWQAFARQGGTDEQSRAVRAEGHFRVAHLWHKLGRREEARLEYERAAAIQEKLAADFPAVPGYRRNLAQNHGNLGNLLTGLGKRAEAQQQYRKALAIEEKLAADFPAVPDYRSDLATSHNNLGNLLTGLGKGAEAEKQYRKALAIFEKLAADFPAVPDYRSALARSHYNLGALLEDLGKGAEAQQQYRMALDNPEKLAAEYPAVPEYRRNLAQSHNNLGLLLKDLGKGVEAQQQFRKALTIKEKLAADFPAVPAYRHELASSHNNLGTLLAGLGKRAEAEKQYSKALAIQKKLTADFPAVPDYRSDLAQSHYNLGNLLAGLGKGVEAEQQYRKALTIQEKLAADFPAVPGYRRKLAQSHGNLGNLLNDLGKGAEAEQQFRKALAIFEKLAADFPAVPDYRSDLATSHNNLGALLADLGKGAEAEKQYRKALAIQEKLAADFPAVPAYRRNLAGGHNSVGVLLKGLGKGAEAEQQHRKGLAIREKLAADFPSVPNYRRELAQTHNNLGILLAGLGKGAEAQQQYRIALAIREKLTADFPAVPGYRVELGGSYCNFGHLVAGGGKPADSLAWYQKAINTLRPIHEQEPRAVSAKLFLRNSHWARAIVHHRLGQYAEAVKDWDRAIALSEVPRQPGVRAARANSQVRAGQVAEAVAEVAALTTLGPDGTGRDRWNAVQWYDFACIYSLASGKSADRKQEYADRAMELLSKAVKAGYKNASHMKKNTNLDPLRGRADFKKLLGELAR